MDTFRFKIDERTGLRVARPPVAVRMLGPDNAMLRAEIKFRPDEYGGIFTCKTNEVIDAAFRVQVDAGRAGVLILQTCLLPPREDPYDLAVELARHQIAVFMNKSEDWEMFDPSRAPEAVETFEHARHTFTDSLITQDSQTQGSMAFAALDEGLRATDRLAHGHADILLHRKFRNRGASSTTFGTTVSLKSDPATLESSLKGFDVLSMPIRWADIEVKKGTYDFSHLDTWMTWAKTQKRPIVAGPLVSVQSEDLPEWVRDHRSDYSTFRDMCYDFMEAVVSRYIQYVGIWKVVSGIHINGDVRFKPSEMIDLTRTAILLVRQYRRGARTMIEVDDLFGDLAAKSSGSLNAFEYLEQVRIEGLRCDCLGARLIVGGESPSQRSRDLMTVSHALDRFVTLDKPVLISAFGAPASEQEPSAGRWGAAWNPQRQASWVSRCVPLALSKPYVESVIWSSHQDGPGTKGFGLVDSSCTPRLAHEKMLSMRRRLRQPLGPWEGDRSGSHSQSADQDSPG